MYKGTFSRTLSVAMHVTNWEAKHQSSTEGFRVDVHCLRCCDRAIEWVDRKQSRFHCGLVSTFFKKFFRTYLTIRDNMMSGRVVHCLLFLLASDFPLSRWPDQRTYVTKILDNARCPQQLGTARCISKGGLQCVRYLSGILQRTVAIR